jgi:hypothetical protein
MSTYCVTFRVANRTVGGMTYDERRNSIIEAIYSGQGYWDETTSFILVNSGLQTQAFTRKASAGLSANDDLLVAFDPDDMSAAYFGDLKEEDVLASFFASLHQVP